MRTSIVGVVLVLSLAACGHAADPTAPGDPNPVHDVLITVMVPGQCLLTCDPPGGDLHALALVRIVNGGGGTAFLQQCGAGLSLIEQEDVNGHWQNVGPAVSCAVSKGPIALAAGDSVRVNWFFAAGRRRLVLGVAGKADLSDEALDASGAVEVP